VLTLLSLLPIPGCMVRRPPVRLGFPQNQVQQILESTALQFRNAKVLRMKSPQQAIEVHTEQGDLFRFHRGPAGTPQLVGEDGLPRAVSRIEFEFLAGMLDPGISRTLPQGREGIEDFSKQLLRWMWHLLA